MCGGWRGLYGGDRVRRPWDAICVGLFLSAMCAPERRRTIRQRTLGSSPCSCIMQPITDTLALHSRRLFERSVQGTVSGLACQSDVSVLAGIEERLEVTDEQGAVFVPFTEDWMVLFATVVPPTLLCRQMNWTLPAHWFRMRCVAKFCGRLADRPLIPRSNIQVPGQHGRREAACGRDIFHGEL